MKLSILIGAASAAMFATADPAPAQTLFGWDGIGIVDEFTGPPAGPCAYPNGPIVGSFPNIAIGTTESTSPDRAAGVRRVNHASTAPSGRRVTTSTRKGSIMGAESGKKANQKKRTTCYRSADRERPPLLWIQWIH